MLAIATKSTWVGFYNDGIKRVIDPLRSFQAQLSEELEVDERLKRGDIDEIHNLHGLGPTLVGLRIAAGITQRELAKRLGVSESQVSRDERNSYHNISVSRASRILDALGVHMRSVVSQVTPGDSPPNVSSAA